MVSLKAVFLGSVFAATLLSTAFGATPTYTAVDLGSLGGSCCAQATGINDAGQVVGVWFTPGGLSRAFLYSGGTMTDLGTLGGSSSWAASINASGQIAGYSTLVGDASWHAFRYSGGTMTDLGTFGGTHSFARGMNASGQVVGEAFLPGNTSAHAFLYSGGTMTDLGASTFNASGINNAGQVVGVANVPGSGGHAFLYSGGPIIDLGTLGGNASGPNAINNSGQIVGRSYTAGNAALHAFIYSGGSMIDLGVLTPGGETTAIGINDAGHVVGYDYDPIGNVERAFIYKDGIMVDLNSLVSLGDFLTSADGINNSGQIIANSSGHAYLLTPVQPQLTITSPTSLPSGIAGVPYGPVPFFAIGGAGGNHWSAIGLPSGLAIDPNTGVLSGTPAQAGPFNVQFKVTDSNGATASVNLSFTMSPPPPPRITSVSPNPVTGSNGLQTFFINGQGFVNAPGLRVRLTWPGGQVDLQGDQVRFWNSAQLSGSFNFNAGPGNWAAQVFNPDGQGSNTFSFSVVVSQQSNSFALPQLVFGGPWYTALYFANTNGSAAHVHVDFFGNNGAPLAVPLLGIGSVTTRDIDVSPNSTVILEAPSGGTLAEGWAHVTVASGVTGYAVFRQSVVGRADQEAVVALTPESSQTADLTYDDINLTTALAFLNPTGNPETVTIDTFGANGASTGSTQIVLAPRSKVSAVFKNVAGLAGISGKRGRAVFSTTGAVSVLGLRFGGEAFTSIPVTHRPLVPETNSILFALPQLVFGAPWYTALYFSNTTNAQVTFPVTFTGNNGLPLGVPLVGIGTVTSRTVALNAGETAILEAPNTANLAEGWVEATLPPGVTGYGVFRQSIAGRADQEAVVPLTSESNQAADLIYDDIQFTTAVAFLNPTNQQVTVTITIYSASGSQLGTTQVVLAPRSKASAILKTLPGLASVAGHRGWAAFSVSNGAVSVLGLRFGGEAFTSIPTTHE